MSPMSAIEVIGQDIHVVHEASPPKVDDCVPSIPSYDPTPEEEVAPFDKDELRQRIVAAIALLNKFRNSQLKAEAGAAEDGDAKSEPDMNCSEESTVATPVSSGLHTPPIFSAHESDTSYSEEPSCEIEEPKIEGLAIEEPATEPATEPTIEPHNFAEADDTAAYGEIPLEHLASPEKYSNQYLEVKKSKLGGNGVFSKIDLKRGQLILAERPTIAACPNSLYDELDKLAPEVRAAFLRMHSHKRSADQEDRQAIFLTNAFVIQEVSCIYLIGARFNHACQYIQSVEYRIAPGRVIEFRMMNDVPAGTELTISYGPLSPRQLYSMWGFRCACGGCTPISDEEVARMDGVVNAKGIW
ncbi:SET domain-containing protein [Annulohypoxylon bovei var. microspora]|nr:SET domain-containing protein [Annulohypoxylon bovei var. microspora]